MRDRITLFACVKPFRGAADLAQRNAITSWTRLSPRPDIFVFGGDEETPAICQSLGVKYIKDTERNRWGTIVLSGLFATAQRVARTDVLCYCNADIILMDDFAQAVDAVTRARQRFLMIGQRCDLDVTQSVPFDHPQWESTLRAEALAKGKLLAPWAIDYFVFTRGLLDPVPPFAVGRPAFDNWFIYRARSRWAAVIDATPVVLAVHQNHDYSFHPDGWHGIRESEEASLNTTLAGGPEHLFLTTDRTHILTPSGLRLDVSAKQLRRLWDRLPVTAPPLLRPPVRFLYRLWKGAGVVLRAVGLRRQLPEPSTSKHA
jgi:hypothetical protein